jgi:hypothetical protein
MSPRWQLLVGLIEVKPGFKDCVSKNVARTKFTAECRKSRELIERVGAGNLKNLQGWHLANFA